MDIDKLVSDVMKRETTFMNIVQERDELLATTSSLNSFVKRLTDSQKQLCTENDQLRESIRSLEECFTRKYDYKRECEALREKILGMEKESTEALQSSENRIEELQLKLQAQERSSKADAEKSHAELEEKIRVINDRRQTEIEELLHTSQNEKHKFEEAMREKNAEFSKLRIEWDAKRRKMQELIVKLQNTAGSNHTGTDIFRRKLQHQRETASKRIAELEAQVSELKARLEESSKQPSQSFISGYALHIANTTKGTTSKRKKPN